jgi:hypothetical protein
VYFCATPFCLTGGWTQEGMLGSPRLCTPNGVKVETYFEATVGRGFELALTRKELSRKDLSRKELSRKELTEKELSRKELNIYQP